MSVRHRLSICYAAPGQNMVPWAGPTRNVLSVAEALSEWADVTVAFRRAGTPPEKARYRVMAIEPGAFSPDGASDDNAARGVHPVGHLSYCRRLASFARQHAGEFDVVLEKGWRLSGWLAANCRRLGVPAIVVENDLRFWTEPVDSVRQITKYALHGIAHAVAGACCRRTSRVIAETDALKDMLVAERRLSSDRIEVVGLGVDHGLFQPLDQREARAALAVSPDAFVMLYVGAMDEYHDLGPVLAALASVRPDVELHVVGGGEYRERYERQAGEADIACRFFGRVPHASVPRHIASADLCIAPYRTDAFRGRLVTFSTLKIPEYMACARPVVSVSSPRISSLIHDGVTGFVFPNAAASWRDFLGALPPRERLAAMGAEAAQAVASITWTGTAAKYLDVCEQVISSSSDLRSARVADPTCLTR
jgi:D-inositol-3-phosphate glycosyltransferase